MAISKKGSLTEATGKIGNKVFYNLNGQGVIRIAGQRRKPFKPREIANQHRMRLVNAFVKTFKDFYPIGYEFAAMGTTSNPYNKAISHNYQAVSGEYPTQYFDYSKSFVSKGDIPPVEDAVFTVQADGLHFSWNPQFDSVSKFADDRVLLLINYPGFEFSEFLDFGAKRSAGSEILKIGSPITFRKSIGHVYIAFVNILRKSISDSQYLGQTVYGVQQ